MTALEVVEAYLAARRALGVLLDRQGRFLRQFVRETGNTPLSDVTPTAVASFLRGRSMPTATWRAKRAALAGLYRYAISRGFAVASPLPEHPPKLAPPQTPLRVLERGVAASTRCDCSAQPSSQSPPVNDLSDVALAALRLRVTSRRGDRT